MLQPTPVFSDRLSLSTPYLATIQRSRSFFWGESRHAARLWPASLYFRLNHGILLSRIHKNSAPSDVRLMDIRDNVRQLEKRIAAAAERAGRSPTEITVIAVTKTVEPGLIQKAFEAGVRHFGENRVQEAMSKIGQLPTLEPSPTWHMVGHLQTNKAKPAVRLFDIIHSVDSVRLAEVISRNTERDIPILVQVDVSGETSKSGFPAAEVGSAVEQIASLPHLEIKGLMTIAPLTSDPEEVRPIFRQLRLLRDSLGLKHLSMGMTDDFEVAIEEGATMVRIGRAIFGERKR